MNATLTVDGVQWYPRATSLVPIPVRRCAEALYERASRMPKRQRALMGTLAVAVSLASASLISGPAMMGYLFVFGFSLFSNALPIPFGTTAVMVAFAMILNPIVLAVLAGVGGALGKITGYAVGCSSRRLISDKKIPRWLTRYAERHMVASILVISIVPNPLVDLIGVIAGRVGYPLRLFLTYSIKGRVLQSTVLVYAALWNLSLFSVLPFIG